MLNPAGVIGRRWGNKTTDHVLTRWNRGEGVIQNHSWLLNDTGWNCAGPLIYGFFSIVATELHHLWLVKSADAKPRTRRNYIQREGQLYVLCTVLTAWSMLVWVRLLFEQAWSHIPHSENVLLPSKSWESGRGTRVYLSSFHKQFVLFVWLWAPRGWGWAGS